uniref:Timeless N-terminal domain-containing protein n=1 Tax=Romanomermis culicivorax TaxID=13658 RepID=A0A915JGS4_ROMCU
TLKDLIRYLRRDNDRFSVRKLLCESNVIAHDLVPLLYTYPEDSSIFDASIRLLINLTQPLAHLFKNRIDIDPENRELFNKLRCSLALNKQAFVDQKIFDCISSKAGHLLSLDDDNLQEDDKVMLERILTCVRNILSLPKNDEDSLRTEFDANVNDHIVEGVLRSGFGDILIHIANSDDFRYLHLITVEVIALVVKDYKPEELVVDEDEARSLERVKKEEELSNMYSETKMKKTEATKRISRRPTNFAGTYVVSGLKALKDDHNIVLKKALSSPYDLNFQNGKRPLRTRMYRRPKVALPDEQGHISTF